MHRYALLYSRFYSFSWPSENKSEISCEGVVFFIIACRFDATCSVLHCDLSRQLTEKWKWLEIVLIASTYDGAAERMMKAFKLLSISF